MHEHLDSEFADAALWIRELPGSRAGSRALAETGVRLGIISNADGLIGQRLAEQEILQVGPGIGVPVECVIDSGAVGVMKPDPRIFHLALDAMGDRRRPTRGTSATCRASTSSARAPPGCSRW